MLVVRWIGSPGEGTGGLGLGRTFSVSCVSFLGGIVGGGREDWEVGC